MKRVRTALLLIDVINDMQFPGSHKLVAAARRVAPRIERLAARAREAHVPVIYANDNFGQWRSDLQSTLRRCTADKAPGRELGLRLRPQEGDYFVLKPQHSGFFCTPLELLLSDLGARGLVVVGFATDLCVLITAHDAHMRGYKLWVPSDCTASNSAKLTSNALLHLRSALHAQTPSSTAIDFERIDRELRSVRRSHGIG
jgi:nicotinamidase-related amidase